MHLPSSCLLGFLASLFLFTACGGSNRLAKNDLKIYHKTFHVDYKLVAEAEDLQLALRLPIGKYAVRIGGFETLKGKVSLFQNSGQHSVSSERPLRFPIPLDMENFILEINVVDLENHLVFHDILEVDLANPNSWQTITAKTKEGMLVFRPYVKLGGQINLSHHDPNIKQFQVRRYKEIYRPAPPPFVEGNLRFTPKGTALETYSVDKDNPLHIKEEGLYFIQSDPNNPQGIFLSCFEEDYPKITRLNQLITAIRYITTNEEYECLRDAKDKKLALDEYWLARTSSKERARNLISAFYNRIREANIYFTSYKEGWKTDRGMIYTIFGQPDEVEKHASFEYWHYDYIEYRRNVAFFFDKENEQFLLRRGDELELPWMEQIHIWREGLVP